MFEEDFQAALRVWRGRAEHLLIFIDANDHILNTRFMTRLYDDNSLELVEGTHHVVKTTIATYNCAHVAMMLTIILNIK